MSEFIVSARKYRPETFKSVVGQASIATTLKNAISSKHLGHAYLFCGPRGVGKTTCARIFAKTINCQDLNSETEPCNKCESCLSFNESRSYSIHELDAASNNTVDDIRNLNEQVRIPPQVGKYSVYIIDEVHMLSQSAFNAFLKTLEEPPAHAVFILATTEKHKIIPTILSRCQIFDFNRIKVPDTVAYLEYIAGKEGIEYEKEAFHVIAQKADGAMRDALSIFDQVVSFSGGNISYQQVIENLNILDFEYYFKLSDSFINSNVSEALLIFDEILDKGFDAHNFINGLASHLRELMVSLDSQTITLLEVSENLKEKYLEQARKFKALQIFDLLEVCSQLDLQYKSSRNQRLLIELGLIKMANLLAEKKKPEPAPAEPEVSQAVLQEKDNEEQLEKAEEISAEPKPQKSPDIAKEIVVEDPPQPSGNIKRNLVRTSGISIKDALNRDTDSFNLKEETEKEDMDPDSGEENEFLNEFTDEQLTKAWNEYAEKIKEDKPSIYISMTNRTPILKENFKIEVHLENESQMDDFNKSVKPSILNHLVSELKNTSIQIESVLKQEESNGKKLYTSEDKFNYLSNKNPDLIKLKQEFNLDLD